MMINAQDIHDGINIINQTQTEADLESARLHWLGKKGLLTNAFKALGALDKDERVEKAKSLNEFKEKIQAALVQSKLRISQILLNEKLNQQLDMTLPARDAIKGNTHPISQVINQLHRFFELRGFTSYSAEHNFDVEEESNNFSLLNIPENHPARSMQDTFFIGSQLLRTHVSASQPRILKQLNPPIKAVVFGRVYRSDQPDVTHVPVFHQMECLYIDKKCHFGHLKDTIDAFIRYLFGHSMKTRYRSSYFPFTEPSVEIDVWMPEEKQWLEILGAGMVHPNVIKNCGHDPDSFRGFAFGVGIERLAMLYFGLKDVRQLYGADVELLSGCDLWQ
ncbi:MAG: phenylalanine--tRNA ligase subunit alpha [Legionellales bacterium]|nr:phenylalanine--tRNA ligase subunit alpha [Legionellales bacterium]|tara:strand:+ start:2215 stop:3216 length:1002 start_codon:yes stop_codon:yes gene_type:complete